MSADRTECEVDLWIARVTATRDASRRGARASAAAQRLAEHALGRAVGDPRWERHCAVCGSTRHGKPRALEGRVEFSVSHTNEIAVVAVAPATCRVGVDVEVVHLSRDLFSLGEHIRHPREEGAAKVEEIYGYWTRKEAVTKMTGEGLSRPFRDVWVSHPRYPPQLLKYGDLSPRSEGLRAVEMNDLDPVWINVETPHVGTVCVETDATTRVIYHDIWSPGVD